MKLRKRRQSRRSCEIIQVSISILDISEGTELFLELELCLRQVDSRNSVSAHESSRLGNIVQGDLDLRVSNGGCGDNVPETKKVYQRELNHSTDRLAILWEVDVGVVRLVQFVHCIPLAAESLEKRLRNGQTFAKNGVLEQFPSHTCPLSLVSLELA